MNLRNKLSSFSNRRTAEQSLLTSVFIWAGTGLLSIFLVGLIIWSILFYSGLLAPLNNGQFNWGIYDLSNQALQTIRSLSFVGVILIILSFFLRLIWIFRVETVSKTFIYFTFTTYIIAQGIGFGFLFSTWNAPELLAIFGITGGLFAVMALVGIFAKNLRGILPFIIFGGITVLFLGLINMILYFSGIYSNTLIFLVMTLSGLLALAYIAFDIWWIKRTSEFYKNSFTDPDSRFRLVSFFAFQLLTDFIWLFWIVIRFYSRALISR